MSDNPSPHNPESEAKAKTESSPSSPQETEQLEGLFDLMSDLQIAISNSPTSSQPENSPSNRQRKVPPPPSLMKGKNHNQSPPHRHPSPVNPSPTHRHPSPVNPSPVTRHPSPVRKKATGNRQQGKGKGEATNSPRPRTHDPDLNRGEELEEFLQSAQNGNRTVLPPLPAALSELIETPLPNPAIATDKEKAETEATPVETQAETLPEQFPETKKSSSFSAWLYGEGGEDTEETVERLRLLLLDLLLDEAIFSAGDKEKDREKDNLSLNEATQRQLAKLDRKLHDPELLGQLIAPVFGKLLQRKIDRSPEEIVKAFAPLIDLMIGERGREDKAAMIKVLAGIIPGALSKQIGDAPDEVIQAIAPAMGRSIKEQIRLDKDAMVDALYPVIGNSVSKYMGEAIENINKQIESAFSLQGIYRKLRARMRGVSEAELILTKSMPFEIQAAFLIHKESGLVIAEAQKSDSQALEADMMAGMLTAIRSFASECVPQEGKTSELTEVDYESFQIVMEVAGYCYIATVTQGDPPAGFYTKLRNTLSAIILNYSYGELIEKYNGDPSTIPR
ncbi:MAG: hypothetical protein AB4290_22055, partial [Spirulina sp.]